MSFLRTLGAVLLLLAPLLVASMVFMVWTTVGTYYLVMAAVYVTYVCVGILFLSLMLLVSKSGLSFGSVGRETPKGSRVSVSSLGQLPGTSSSVLPTLRTVLRSLPPGTVVVAAARTEELAQRYVRLGFTRGKSRRVYLQL